MYFPLHLVSGQDCIELVQENVDMFGLKDQSWPQSDGCWAASSTVDAFFAQVTQNLVTPLKNENETFHVSTFRGFVEFFANQTSIFRVILFRGFVEFLVLNKTSIFRVIPYLAGVSASMAQKVPNPRAEWTNPGNFT